LVCIQGEWSNIVDAKIKGGLAALASAGAPASPYNPLYARAPRAPKPWGVTALFAEYTGDHAPLAVDWSLERTASLHVRDRDAGKADAQIDESAVEIPSATVGAAAVPASAAAIPPTQDVRPRGAPDLRPVGPARHEGAKSSFGSLWEFAVAVNRGDPAALDVASNGATSEIAIDGPEARKLLGTMWFRGVVPRLSPDWRERILAALVASAPIPDHVVKVDRRGARLSELSHTQLQEIFTRTHVADAARADLELLITVGRLWGAEALGRFQFSGVSPNGERTRLTSVLQGFRR
jgi:hypothetical protein